MQVKPKYQQPTVRDSDILRFDIFSKLKHNRPYPKKKERGKKKSSPSKLFKLHNNCNTKKSKSKGSHLSERSNEGEFFTFEAFRSS